MFRILTVMYVASLTGFACGKDGILTGISIFLFTAVPMVLAAAATVELFEKNK